MRKKADWGADHERSTEAPEHGTEPLFPTSTRDKKSANGKARRAKERERNRGVERAGAALISENLQFSSGVDTSTNFLFTAPLEVMVQSLQPYDLIAIESPVEVAPIPLHLHWAARQSADPEHMFFRSLLEESHQHIIRACQRCEIRRLLD